MRIDVELFGGGEESGAVLVGSVAGVGIGVHRHPRAGQSENGPTHELRLVGPGVTITDVALWKKSGERGEYLNGQLLKGGNWWVSVNYLDQDAPSGAVANLTVRHSLPKKQTTDNTGADDFGGRF